MKRVNVRVKRIHDNRDTPLPAYQSEGSAGLDLRASINEPISIEPGLIRLVPTGIAISLPEGFEAQIRPRSGLALRHGIGMVNSPGTIDSDYRGEIGVILINWGEKAFTIKNGDRIAQMVVSRVWRCDFVEVDRLDETARGGGGFGHSGVE